jgi:hypothetical protein
MQLERDLNAKYNDSKHFSDLVNLETTSIKSQ